MYQINKTKNDITKLEERRFSDLGFKERDNLQEWIAKNPEVLGEDLLVIQKEYDGFNDTNERLDLLALDKEGGLVIIENKLDDTGRDVVWQSLKYTSYCSTLTSNQIIAMFQDYLKDNGIDEDAKETILEFLEREEEDLLLNKNDQRIILVANKYRKEVTSTVLWLLKHDIHIQCFRATPYSLNEELFLQIEQIIPLPETKEFMIDAMEKEKEEKNKSKQVAATEQKLFEFWMLLKQSLEKNNNNFLDKVTAKKSFSIGTYRGRGKYAYCIGRKTLRVELYLPNDTDKKRFDAMYNYKDEIEQNFPNKITWQRLDGKKASRIKFDCPLEEMKKISDWNIDGNRNAQVEWFRTSMDEFYNVINPIWEKVYEQTH